MHKHGKRQLALTPVGRALADADAGGGDSADGAAAVLPAVRPVLNLRASGAEPRNQQSASQAARPDAGRRGLQSLRLAVGNSN